MAPFASDAQRRFLYAFHPKIAKEFSDKTPKGDDLPEKVGSQSAEETKRIRMKAMQKVAKEA